MHFLIKTKSNLKSVILRLGQYIQELSSAHKVVNILIIVKSNNKSQILFTDW